MSIPPKDPASDSFNIEELNKMDLEQFIKQFANSEKTDLEAVQAVALADVDELSRMLRGSSKVRSTLAFSPLMASAILITGRSTFREMAQRSKIFFDDLDYLTLTPVCQSMPHASGCQDPKIKGLLRAYNLSTARRDKAGAKRVLKQLESMGFRP